MTAAERCRSCGAPVLWAQSEKGSLMPLNALPDPNGNVVLVPAADPREAPVARVCRRTDFAAPQSTRFTSHFATCPQAADWRQSRVSR